ncbi:MAG: isocitrate/isopropylmalate family dehydrogenase, partial [Acidobacteriota bacterium]|nr:isocitrate/isopropylmalate family dehydrogenase [Acidobacteriota bacterium]
MDLSILALPGDGIGPDVVAAAERVLDRVAERYGHRLRIERRDFAGAAWDRTGTGFPDDTRAACAEAEAILLGAAGDPRHDVLPAAERPERALLELRRMLGTYANLRPIKVIRVLDSSPFRPR